MSSTSGHTNYDMILGFSLSDFFFWPNKRLNFLLPNLQRVAPQANAIELSYHSSIKEILDNNHYLKKYKHRSVHLPTDKSYAKWIKDLNKNQNKLKLNYLVIHPNVIHTWNTLKKSKIPVLIENMDGYKKSFKAQKELNKFFNQSPAFKMCLDINHLESQFPGQTPKWLDKFKNKIAEIHLASVDRKYYKNWCRKKLRHALCLFDKTILKNFRTKKYPIILEGIAPPLRWNLVKEEFNLVKKHLK